MRIARWILGIPLAFAGAALLMTVFVYLDTSLLSGFFVGSYVLLFNVIQFIISMALFVVLVNVFLPCHKRRAAIIGVCIVCLFELILLIVQVKSPYTRPKDFITGYLGFIGGASLGFVISHAIFKKRGSWLKPVEIIPEELETY